MHTSIVFLCLFVLIVITSSQSEDKYFCTEGRTTLDSILTSYRTLCDEENNCPDGSDEVHCAGKEQYKGCFQYGKTAKGVEKRIIGCEQCLCRADTGMYRISN